MATPETGWEFEDVEPADPSTKIPGATELEQALLDGHVVGLAQDNISRTWLPAPGAFDPPDPEAFRSTALAAAEESRLKRGLPPE